MQLNPRFEIIPRVADGGITSRSFRPSFDDSVVEGTGDSFSLLFWGEEFTSSTPKLTISTKNEAFSCGLRTLTMKGV